MKKTYPFDNSIKSHVIIAISLAIWVFVFLYFTEPLDVNQFSEREKLIFLPGYGLVAGCCYLLFLPLQHFLYKSNNNLWTLLNEIIFLLTFCVFSITIARLFYVYIIMANDRNPYELWFMLKSIFIHAITTILPIIIIGRFGLGKYKQKRLEDQKIEIKGEGNYEGIRLLVNDLISIQSSDNYIEVFYVSGNTLKKTLIRNKLSNIDEEFSELIRTHRSFVINPFHFQTWKTEKGKHVIILSYNIQVPISKTYLETVKVALNFTTST